MEFLLPNTTLLNISGHFKRFQLTDSLSQLPNLANNSVSPEFFSFLRAWAYIRDIRAYIREQKHFNLQSVKLNILSFFQYKARISAFFTIRHF